MDDLKKAMPLLLMVAAIAAVMWALNRRNVSVVDMGYETVPAIPQTAVQGVTTDVVSMAVNEPRTRGQMSYPSTYSVQDLFSGLVNVGDHDSRPA